jgi:hypothetical protein
MKLLLVCFFVRVFNKQYISGTLLSELFIMSNKTPVHFSVNVNCR